MKRRTRLLEHIRKTGHAPCSTLEARHLLQGLLEEGLIETGAAGILSPEYDLDWDFEGEISVRLTADYRKEE